MVHHGRYAGRPFLELGDPVGKSAQGSDDEMWAAVVVLLTEEADDSNRLDGFAWGSQM